MFFLSYSGTDTPVPCPIGTYREEVSAYEVEHCTACTAGHACEFVGLAHPNQLCAAGYYCTLGSTMFEPIGESFGDICPAGYYCRAGTVNYQDYPCENGTYSNTTGRGSPSECTQCDPGRVCNGEGLLAPNGICAPGFFCSGGASSEQPIDGVTGDLCTVGHYCSGGTGQSTSVTYHHSLVIM